MDWLEEPNDNFGGLPVCPFLVPERKQDKLLIDFYDYTENSLFSQMIKDFDKNDKYTTALYLHVNEWKNTKNKRISRMDDSRVGYDWSWSP